ncbi:MAG: DoxX family membrane protein [Candidatus Eremiobacteraeota bacterium]|nr:DoxX family membrane protein [Candidatus Eremiobacteraeota bacterium]
MPRLQWLPLIARIVVGAVFLAAGVLKVGHAADLGSTIVAFRLDLPPAFVGFSAIALPLFEIVLRVYLLLGWQLRIVSLVSVALLAVFIAALSSVVVRGIPTPCGCFGPRETDPVTWWTVARDGAAIVPAIYLAWWSWRTPSR